MRWTLILFSLRVPLSCALAMALLAPLGAFPFSPCRGMLEGLFDVSPWGAFWTGLASWLSAAACWLCSLLTLNYGEALQPRAVRRPAAFRFFPSLALAYAVVPASLLAGVLEVSGGAPAALLAGSAAGLAVSAGAWRLLARLRHRPSGRLPVFWIDHPGYLDETTGEILPGHWMASLFTILFVGIWLVVGLLRYSSLSNGSVGLISPPSLSFVVILGGLLALALSGLAFFFDRYRIPVILPWAALLAIASVVPTADHFVESVPPITGPRPGPVDVLRITPTPVLVCSSGGGIAAAAWTAQVLASLDRLNPGAFTSSLALFSAASGGSVGGLQFVAACRTAAGCGDAFRRASQSSLDAAAWGLAGPDFVRSVVPFAGAFLGDIGRGWALERAWDPDSSLRVPMTAWPLRPALVFNATVVESGEGVGLSNIDLAPELPGLINLSKKASQRNDITAISAARLSASFPFITPAPRLRSLGYHFADGGYYDNYGVGAAVAFLNAAYLTSTPRPLLPRRVLLIEIRASASPTRRRPVDSAFALPLFQWLSPAHTMLNVRDTAQRRRNDTTLALLTQALAARGVLIERVQFENPRTDVPLSWHLTAPQSAALQQDWRTRFEHSPEATHVAAFLAQQR